jgi:predicted PurR-regulated permease PerM
MSNGGDSNSQDGGPSQDEPGSTSSSRPGKNEPTEAKPAAKGPLEGGKTQGRKAQGGKTQPPDPNAAWYRRISRSRKLLLPMVTLGLLVVILVSFSSILLPFVFACALVYLMEPIVRRLSPKLPRWAAVILVYVAFFGVLTLGVLFVVPRFVSEIVRFAETVPETVTQFREENLPGINDRVQDFLEHYLPVTSQPPDYEPARHVVHDAWQDAANQATATAVAQARGRAASDIKINVELSGLDGQLERNYNIEPGDPSALRADWINSHGQWSMVGTSEKPAVRLVPQPDGSYEVFLGGGEVEISRVDDDVWSVRKPQATSRVEPASVEVRSLIDLEARVNELIEGAINTSQARISSVIGYAQALVVGVIQVLVAFVLTFMVAAFISIDLPGVMRFFREMVPRDYREGYDELRSRVDRGLSGVIRGQLLICLVNGILTYVGLVILDIKFSLLLAVVAGVLSLIPIFGTIISTIPIVVIGLMNGFVTGFLALLWILGIHFIEANILNPQIIGTSAHIHPVIVIFALLAGESAFGLVGALLAVPVASIVLELFKFARDKVWARDEAEVTSTVTGETS